MTKYQFLLKKKQYLCTVNEKWVHPLREYVLNCRPYDDTQPVDWIVRERGLEEVNDNRNIAGKT